MNHFYASVIRSFCLALFASLLVTTTASAQRPTSFDFGPVSCGVSQCDSLWIPSVDTIKAVVDVWLRDGDRFDYEVRATLPLELPNDDSLAVKLCVAAEKHGDIYDDVLFVVIEDSAFKLDTMEIAISAMVTGPAIDIEADRLDFPVTAVSATGTEQVMIRNVGEEDISLDESDFIGILSPFAITSTFPIDIPSGDSAVLEIEFTPDSVNTYHALLQITGRCGNYERLEIFGRTPDVPNKIRNGFGEVPCEVTVCDTLWVIGTGPDNVISNLRLRDGTSFRIPDEFFPPISIVSGDSVGVPLCFSPSRRGTIVDSALIVVERGGKPDSIRVRLTGTGIGPNIVIDPIVLNFPKTTPPGVATLPTTFENTGERPFLLTAADLPIPPPFRLLTPMPQVIEPGQSVFLQVEFRPTERGIFSIPINVSVGCNRVLQVGLNGSTNFIGTGGVLRVSKVGFNPANDERVPCDVSQCTEVTLSNVGNASLRVDSIAWADGSFGFFFPIAPALPLIIGPNESRTVEVCINATQAGRLQDTLRVKSNDRRSIAFGMVIDASNSMDTALDCGANSPTRIEEAIKQTQLFIDNTLLYLPALNIQDQIAIIDYSSERKGSDIVPVVNQDFPLTSVTDDTRAAARASVAGISLIGGTWTGHALRTMIRTLAESPLEDRVIVLQTDGTTNDPDLDSNKLETIIREADSLGIRIFTIGLKLTAPAGIAYLNALANGTGGLSIIANDCGSLEDAFAQITEIVSQGSTWQEPFKITVTSPRILADNVRFDSLYIFSDTCVSLTLTNVGEGDAIVNGIDFQDMAGQVSTEFSLDGESVDFPFTIPENEQKTIDVCFRPNGLRLREGLTVVDYNDCNQEPGSGAVTGVGVAEANLRIDDERMALPGDAVTLPIYGDSALMGYDVDTIVWTVRWNRTMLELNAVRPGNASNGATVVMSGPVTFDGRFASVELTAAGPALQASGQLAEMDFTFLRGDSLAAYVELVSARFQDGNPKAVLKNAGVVVYDSTCFRELRPILYKGPAAKVSIGSVSPVPATGSAINVALDASAETSVRLDLFDASGSVVHQSQQYALPKGESVLDIEVGELRSGVYHLRIRTDDGETLFSKLIIQR